MKKFRNITVLLLITYLLVELVCFIFIKTRFKAAHFPTFRFTYNYTKYDFSIAELSPYWGTWHYPEKYVEKKQCFEVEYHINAYGARDKERIKLSDTNRVVFLGDSFIEGYGLNAEHRMTDLLEKKTKREMLNFSCGYFTPTQELLVYRHLASLFTHNTVVIGILPFNDLLQDDSSFHENDRFVHYQPFYQHSGKGYELIYREDRLEKSTFNKEGYAAIQNTPRQRIHRFLKEFSFWYNIFQYIKYSKPVVNEQAVPYSGYFDYTAPQLAKLTYILSLLKEAANGKQVIVVTIPVYNDFLRYGSGRGKSIATELARFCKGNGMEYIDLLEEFRKQVKDPSTLYFTCDAHWNEKANNMAAEIILPLLRK